MADGHGCGVQGARRSDAAQDSRQSPRPKWADLERTMRSRGHDAASGGQASRHPGSRQSGGNTEARPGEAALSQPRSDQRDRRTVDRQIRARAFARAVGSEKQARKGTPMSSKFVYVTYIRTTPEKLWEALTKPEFTRAYWSGVTHECAWDVGSPWRLVFADGRVADAGEVVAIDRPRRLGL